jgi:hypothetical protein
LSGGKKLIVERWRSSRAYGYQRMELNAGGRRCRCRDGRRWHWNDEQGGRLRDGFIGSTLGDGTDEGRRMLRFSRMLVEEGSRKNQDLRAGVRRESVRRNIRKVRSEFLARRVLLIFIALAFGELDRRVFRRC